MYFGHLLGIISLLSIIVSASIDYSDFTSADDESEPVLATLLVDQVNTFEGRIELTF